MSNLNPKTFVKLKEGEFEIYSHYLSYGRATRLMLFIGDEATAMRISNAIRSAEIIAHQQGRLDVLYSARDAHDD